MNWVLDADIAGFFDAVSRDWLIRFVGHAPSHRRTDSDHPDFALPDRVSIHGAIRGGYGRGRFCRRLIPPRNRLAGYPSPGPPKTLTLSTAQT